jgi:hypothetical protein
MASALGAESKTLDILEIPGLSPNFFGDRAILSEFF